MRIDAPAAEIFQFLTEPGSDTRWVVGRFKTEALTEGPLRPGSRSRTHVKALGKTLTFENVVLSIDADRKLVEQAEHESVIAKQTLQLNDFETSTEVKMEHVIKYMGANYKYLNLLLRLHRRRYERDCLEQNLRRLKQVIESPDAVLPEVTWTSTQTVFLIWPLLVIGLAMLVTWLVIVLL